MLSSSSRIGNGFSSAGVRAALPNVLLKAGLWAMKRADTMSPNFFKTVNIDCRKTLIPLLEMTKVFNLLAEGVYIINDQGEIVYANDAARSLFSIPKAKSAHLMNLFTPESVSAAFERIRNSPDDSPREELILSMKRADGVEFPVETIPRRVHFSDGAYIVGGIKLSMLAAVQALLETVATRHTEKEVCDTVIRYAMKLFKIDAASIKVDFGAESFKVISREGLGAKYEEPRSLPLHQTASYQASRFGKTVEKETLSENTSAASKYGMRSGIFIPLRANLGRDASGVELFDEIGTFCVYTRDLDRFHSLKRNEKYLEMFARLVSIRIREARLYAQEQNQKVCKELLNHIAQAINSPLELKKVLEVLVEESEKMFKKLKGDENIRSCSVYIALKDSDALKCMASAGRIEEKFDARVGGGSVMGAVGKTKKPKFVQDAEKYFNGTKEHAVVRRGSFVSIPIVLADELLGVLNISSNEKNMFDEAADGPIIKTLAEMAGTAVNKAELHEETRRLKDKYEWMSLMDQLVPTLFNHGIAEYILFNLLNEAKTSAWPLSIIYLDIDHFKEINDLEGHLVGTRRIKEVGAIVSRRKDDGMIPCKFGGDEFLVIAPGGDKRKAFEVAKKLQEEILKEVGLSVTIGISSFPEDGQDVNELLQKADTKKKVQRGVIILA